MSASRPLHGASRPEELLLATTRTADTRPPINTALVRDLVDTQFPQWAELPLELLEPAGSDHVIYRLGEELSVRLPRHAGAIGQAEKEYEWLPRLAPQLPLTIPVPMGVGEPDFGYPWRWAVSRWLEGEVATVEALADSSGAAVELAEFLTALQRFAPEDIPAEETRYELTAPPLADRDQATRAAIAEVDGAFDTAAMTELWNAALSAPAWDRPPAWFHGDFHTGNLLTVDGRLSAVIDFGGLGIGDPACDLTIAFTLMSAESRAAFRAALGVDDATWTRGRGWALATGLNAYISYAAVNPRVAAQTTRQITEALIG
ncbi:aminoglycoside phosphotransferase (APT) family kinase protein [Nonomuraea polychroma]|uniref:Aminoglycoside phosphotransferase (APT) family kinase protein n=1 Tax=Nonomuraea polychroma TaxID=46176 RepID=A0A438MLE5_9ACTN|nr:aminoglycoside phosphotransferase (APT) family kinase protein [Nonomuraea polychroma]